MCCCPCFSRRKDDSNKDDQEMPVAQPRDITPSLPPVHNTTTPVPVADANNVNAKTAEQEKGNDAAKAFNFRELATATKNFRQECLLSESGTGRVFKATLPSTGQIVAVRQLDRSKTQGSREFQEEVSTLSLLHHPNLVNLIGYCADGEQRLLVYEYLPSGSLENHLFDISEGRRPLDWSTRMKIASGIAQGLEYLHEQASPPIIYHDLKSSNVLIDEMHNPKLSEHGLAKLLQSGNNMNMSAYGYCAPEHGSHGEITSKSDVYSFGVVLLELITGRRAYDAARPMDEQSLVSWAQPIFRDPKRFPDMADQLLRKEFSVKTLNQAVGIASMCLQEEPSVRPFMTDVVATLSFLATAPPDEPIPSIPSPAAESSSQSYQGQNNDNNQDHSEHKYDALETGFSYDDSSDDEDKSGPKSEKSKHRKSSCSSLSSSNSDWSE